MDKKFPITNDGILVSLVVLMFFIVTQFASAQTDYRNFNSYDSKYFSLLFPPAWHVWNSTGAYGQPGATQVTIGKEIPANNIIDISNFPTKIEVTINPGEVIGITSEIALSSWIDESYSPQSQRNHGMYTVQNTPISLSGIPAHKVTYNIDYHCGGSTIPIYNMVIFAYSPNALSENTYSISLIGPVSKMQDISDEVQSIIDSFKVGDPVDYDALIAKVEAGNATMKEAWAAFGESVRRNAGIITAENHNTSLIDYTDFHRISNTPISANGQYLSLPYTSNPPRC